MCKKQTTKNYQGEVKNLKMSYRNKTCYSSNWNLWTIFKSFFISPPACPNFSRYQDIVHSIHLARKPNLGLKSCDGNQELLNFLRSDLIEVATRLQKGGLGYVEETSEFEARVRTYETTLWNLLLMKTQFGIVPWYCCWLPLVILEIICLGLSWKTCGTEKYSIYIWYFSFVIFCWYPQKSNSWLRPFSIKLNENWSWSHSPVTLFNMFISMWCLCF